MKLKTSKSKLIRKRFFRDGKFSCFSLGHFNFPQKKEKLNIKERSNITFSLLNVNLHSQWANYVIKFSLMASLKEEIQ